MCGRYGFGNPARLGTLPLGVDLTLGEARYNMAPTQEVPLVLEEPTGRRAVAARWGLVPFWATDPSIGNRLINARADTVADKPSFRNAFKQRRGLMPADLIYEWQAIDGQKTKQPWCIRLADDAPFAMAALWERWSPRPSADQASEPLAAEPLTSCTIITTDANAVMAPMHHRMPVILHEADYDRWLDPRTSRREALALLRPFDGPMRAYRVSSYVNAPRNSGAACCEPIDPPPTSFL
jgi:putative SOS response-associated peptidase YedK